MYTPENSPINSTVETILTWTSLYQDREKVFSPEDFDIENHICYISTPEQFIRTLAWDGTGSSSQWFNKFIITRNLYFQNDPIFREGFDAPLYVGGIVELTKTYKPADDIDEIIIQGLHQSSNASSEGHFMTNNIQGANYTNTTFQRIYFKDCVHTKTKDDYTFEAANSNRKITFNNCKISIHVRASEYGYKFDSQYVNWNNCARYIEFSDLNMDSTPSSNIFLGTTYATSTIVRNIALAKAYGTSYDFISNTSYCSWDIQVYLLDRFFAYQPVISASNCFISIIVDRFNSESTEFDFSFGTMTGVNIINSGSAEHLVPKYPSNSNVKFLSEADCKDYTVLSRYGFFTNRLYEYKVLTQIPADWGTNYYMYYQKINGEYVVINAASAPTFVEGTFYEKHFLTSEDNV